YPTITTYNKRITYKIEKIKNETRIKETIPCFRSISIFSFLCIIKMIESKIIKMIANIPNKFLCNIQLNTIVSAIIRSEEHTSELQSRFELVCPLLLEIKK